MCMYYCFYFLFKFLLRFFVFFYVEEFYLEVMVLFCDIVGFVQFVVNCKFSDVLVVFNILYMEFDWFICVYDIFRVSGFYYYYMID